MPVSDTLVKYDVACTYISHILQYMYQSYMYMWHIWGLSGKYSDTVNSEAKTSNNMELLIFVLLWTI